LWLGLVVGCGDGKSTGSSEASDDTSTSSTSTDSETSESTDGDWPECLPRSVSSSQFVVGPDQWWGGYDPDINWPPGHHRAVCVVDSTSMEPSQDIEGLMYTDIRLHDCQDDRAQPIALSLDLGFGSDVFVELPPAIEVGRVVRVSYSIKLWVGDSAHVAWYSLRDAETDELLLAAFSDPGPSVAPKIPGEPDLENWLAPFDATLGPFGCEPGGNEFQCEGDNAQRAFVTFTRDGSAWDVLGMTEGDLGDYRVHLGFAGVSDACDGVNSYNAIEGIVIRKL
jgi:hypothetical protein